MKDNLGDRMKSYYENRTKDFLPRRTFVIIRLNGKIFHSYTKPFDKGFIEDMNLTAEYLCKNIQGVKFAFVQSNEISIVLPDFDNINTEAWFNGSVEKMAASKFNSIRLRRLLLTNTKLYYKELEKDFKVRNSKLKQGKKYHQKSRCIKTILSEVTNFKLADFNSRIFIIPQFEEVKNYFIWRQQDAIRNSIQSLAQSLYSHKELEHKNNSQLKEMCFKKGHNWNDINSMYKRGRGIIKNIYANGKLIGSKGKIKLGDLLYQPNIQSEFYPDERGRLLEWANTEDVYCDLEGNSITTPDWCDIPITSIKYKWETTKVPIFSKNKSFLNFIKDE